jgi:hypothetical protein
MKKDEAQEGQKTPDSPAAPAAGMTQELSKAEILAFLEKMKKESPGPEPKRPRKPPLRRG